MVYNFTTNTSHTSNTSNWRQTFLLTEVSPLDNTAFRNDESWKYYGVIIDIIRCISDRGSNRNG